MQIDAGAIVMTFEEWFETTAYGHKVVQAKEAWEFQQQRIDELEEKLDSLEVTLDTVEAALGKRYWSKRDV